MIDTGAVTSKIRVLVVDDSAVVRAIWSSLLGKEADVEIVATAGNGKIALEELKKGPVQIVLLDLEMPEMDGLTTIPHIVRDHPGVKIIIASNLTTRGSKIAVDALTLGASDYITKPSALEGSKGFDNVLEELLRKIRGLAGAHAAVAAPTPIKLNSTSQKFPIPTVVLIGTSTGGPIALNIVLPAIPKEMDLPILVVQHMPPYFTTILADSLGKATGRPCSEAKDGESLQKGHIYIAPGDFHLVLEMANGPILRINQKEPENFCRPAVDPLFRSAAEVLKDKAFGVVLTGLGEDGMLGSGHIVENGGRVIVQDEATSVVWGMPGSVARAGHASEVLPLEKIAPAIARIAKGGSA